MNSTLPTVPQGFEKATQAYRLIYGTGLDTETARKIADAVSEACYESHARGYDSGIQFQKWMNGND
jgi:hypothetical protein